MVLTSEATVPPRKKGLRKPMSVRRLNMEISSQSAGAMDGEPAVSQTKLGAGSVACTGLQRGRGEMALRGHNLG